MKTYAEANYREPFDWNKFLNKGGYILEELNIACGLSASWVTCACGNQCDAIPRSNMKLLTGAPLDKELGALGMKFHHAIHGMRSCLSKGDLGTMERFREMAIRVLDLIEIRAQEILKDMGL